jgi:hypothetical protein
MTRAGQRIAGLEDQVAGLAAEVENLRAGAFVLRTPGEAAPDRYGYGGSRPAALGASRPRHLRLAGGVS